MYTCTHAHAHTHAHVHTGAHTTEHYLELARDLDVMEPKAPEDVYKSHLDKRPAGASHVDSARQNLAATFVNALLNAGFGTDRLLLTEGNKWLYKNKEHGMMSAAASLGLILLWDVDGGLTQIDKFLYSTDDNIKAGALLSVGVLSAGTRNECGPGAHTVHASSHLHGTRCPHGSLMGPCTACGAGATLPSRCSPSMPPRPPTRPTSRWGRSSASDLPTQDPRGRRYPTHTCPHHQPSPPLRPSCSPALGPM